jgi:hypothetical protein
LFDEAGVVFPARPDSGKGDVVGVAPGEEGMVDKLRTVVDAQKGDTKEEGGERNMGRKERTYPPSEEKFTEVVLPSIQASYRGKGPVRQFPIIEGFAAFSIF